jgi:uncharacterized protein (TIGR02996 family)
VIPAAVIERIREHNDIVTVIDRRCPLKPVGNRSIGRCPFHALDEDRSLLVDPARRRFVCLGCGAAGDVLEFVRRFDGVPLDAAARSLGARTDELTHFDAAPATVAPLVRAPAFRITRAGALVDLRVCPQPVLKIGRLRGCHLLLADDPQVSRLHAVIELEDPIRIIDLGTPTGTWINGEQLLTRGVLELGDEVRIGEHGLELLELVGVDRDELPEPGPQASARLCVGEAARAVREQRFADAWSLLGLAWRSVGDPTLRDVAQELERVLGGTPSAWPEPRPNTACWLDAAALAGLDDLRRAWLGRLADLDEGRALELAVLLDRDDDAARMVYADWLQQRGDPRGELIALQLADAGGRLDHDGHARLEALWQVHGERWSAEFVRLGAEVEFRRGFPWLVRHPGLWTVVLIELVRRWTTIERIEGPKVPDVLVDRCTA